MENGFSIIEHFKLFEMGFLASICSVLPDKIFFEGGFIFDIKNY